METIFTQIINKKISSYIIYEDKTVVSFLDINPFTKGHSLVVTKEEYSSIIEIPEFIFVHLFSVVQKISKVLIKTFNAKGINLLNNNGKIAGQKIFHYHVHLIPRFLPKEVDLVFNNNLKFDKSDYNKMCQEIKINFKKMIIGKEDKNDFFYAK
ncbi:HIT family protein [Candidatus Phytoplasma sacchari]|nr:HIT domain-containing protein [Candidatus Phytoplasma sacchari]KAB8122785.1 HIT domain-containing protein [Candidatus Phytoplasma sacchari]